MKSMKSMKSINTPPPQPINVDMLDQLIVFTKGGLVLWALDHKPLPLGLQEKCITGALLDGSVVSETLGYGEYDVKWVLDNTHNLVFMAIAKKLLGLHYVKDLLTAVCDDFVDTYRPRLDAAVRRGKRYPGQIKAYQYRHKFDTVLAAVEAASEQMLAPGERTGPRRFEDTAKGKKMSQRNRSNDTEDDGDQDSETAGMTPDEKRAFEVKKKIEAMRQGGFTPGRSPVKTPGKSPKPSSKQSSEKKSRGWDGKTSRREAEQLDMSEPQVDELPEEEEARIRALRMELRADQDIELDFESDEEEDETGGAWGFFQSLTSGRVLDDAALAPVLDSFRNHLITKNVASEIAERVCKAVGTTLSGTKIGTFASLNTSVRNALEEVMTRILTPAEEVDILRGVRAAQRELRPYTIVFVGVNGVGKSTSLAKVSSWLQQNNHSVLIAACDTFRAGAVEQLRVHSKCIGAELFQKGYNKDASQVAGDAIQKAHADGTNVVVIDTAGRMQDNEPLMRSLAKLVSQNQPDLILFVGEALVGNEAVDQVQKFNAALRDYSPSRETSRQIDGIILTKFDTVDTQTGAVLSMTHTVGKPVVFVGTGQHYTDLKKLNVRTVVKALLR